MLKRRIQIVIGSGLGALLLGFAISGSIVMFTTYHTKSENTTAATIFQKQYPDGTLQTQRKLSDVWVYLYANADGTYNRVLRIGSTWLTLNPTESAR